MGGGGGVWTFLWRGTSVGTLWFYRRGFTVDKTKHAWIVCYTIQWWLLRSRQYFHIRSYMYIRPRTQGTPPPPPLAPGAFFFWHNFFMKKKSVGFPPPAQRLRAGAASQLASNTLLKSDVTSRDHVVRCRGSQECGSRFVNFIRDGTVFA